MDNLGVWIEALASCAIEDNEFAQEMLELKEKNLKVFLTKMREALNGN